MEMLVFSVLNPMDIPSVEHAMGVTPQGVYTMAFFLFWVAISFLGAACRQQTCAYLI